jgi:hypothetical protein
MSIAEESLRLTGIFEAELLVELMLRYWEHPYADEPDFRHDLLEAAAQVLQAAVIGQTFIDDVPSEKMNLVAAVWYAETNSLDAGHSPEIEQRRIWADRVRHAVPSCFCNPQSLE